MIKVPRLEHSDCRIDYFRRIWNTNLWVVGGVWDNIHQINQWQAAYARGESPRLTYAAIPAGHALWVSMQVLFPYQEASTCCISEFCGCPLSLLRSRLSFSEITQKAWLACFRSNPESAVASRSNIWGDSRLEEEEEDLNVAGIQVSQAGWSGMELRGEERRGSRGVRTKQ